VLRELAKCKLDLVGVPVTVGDNGDSELAGVYTFFCESENAGHRLGACFFLRKRIVSALKRVEFVSDTCRYFADRPLV
jgi:hypothetical protein